jgi:tetratricopeptide (TPR) repeat protein
MVRTRPVCQALKFFTLLSALTLPFAGHAADALLKQANERIKAGEYTEAYQLLDAEANQRAGEPAYDYLLGVAALRVGVPEQAIFALERVVAVRPNHAAARMELVNAYVQLGMDHQAQDQLAILEQQQPPPAARMAMDRFQDILRPRLSGKPNPVRRLSLNVGHDSNVGSYPEMDLLGFIPIEPLSSAYSLLRGTMWEPIALKNSQRLDLTLHGQYQQYQEDKAEQFDMGLLHVAALYNHTLNPFSRFGLGIQANKLWLDGYNFRDHIGLNARWEQRLDADLRGDLGLEWMDYRFKQERNDYRQINLNGRLHKTLRPGLRLSGIVGLEQESAQANRFGGDAQRWRLRGETNWQLNPRNVVNLSLSYSETSYDVAYRPGLHNPTPLDIEREDKTTELRASWRYIPASKWEINTELSYRDQESTVRFYNLERRTIQLGLLRNF